MFTLGSRGRAGPLDGPGPEVRKQQLRSAIRGPVAERYAHKSPAHYNVLVRRRGGGAACARGPCSGEILRGGARQASEPRSIRLDVWEC